MMKDCVITAVLLLGSFYRRVVIDFYELHCISEKVHSIFADGF